MNKKLKILTLIVAILCLTALPVFAAGETNITVEKNWSDDLTGTDANSREAPQVTLEVTLTKGELLDAFYPIGSYYETTVSPTTFDPNEKFVGSWKLETEGLVHMSGSPSGANTSNGNTTIGSKNINLVGASDGGSMTTPIAYHVHNTGGLSVNSGDGGNHNHAFSVKLDQATGKTGTYTLDQLLTYGSSSAQGTVTCGPNPANHTHTGATNATNTQGVSSGGSNETGDSNMMPYVNVYKWHRVG